MIASGASGEWSGKAGQIAARQAGNWLYAVPRDGMHILNKATGQHIRYKGGWQVPARPTSPSGGTVIDTEARAAITALIACLTAGGIIAQP